jgi:hypothetical protein
MSTLGSNNTAVGFSMEMAATQPENQYNCSDSQWVSVNDANGFSYTSGYLNFNSVQLNGSDPAKVLDLARGFLIIPVVATATISTGFGSAATNIKTISANDAMLLSPKGPHHLISQVYLKMGGRTIHAQAPMWNLWANEQLKSMNSDQANMYFDSMGFSFDSSESYRLNPSVFETNNSIYADTTYAYGDLPQGYANQGLLNRIRNQCLINPLSNTNHQWSIGTQAGQLAAGTATGLVSTSILQDIAAPSILGVYGIQTAGGALVQLTPTNGVYSTANDADAQIKVIAFQFQYVLPLCFLSQYFRELAPLGSISQMELRLLLKVSSNNSWSVTHDTAPGAGLAFPVVGTSAARSTGETCPFMVAAISQQDGTRGCRVVAVNSPVLTVVAGVGYFNSLPVTALAAQGTGYRVTQLSSTPAQMWIPSVMLTDPMREPLLSNKTKRILYSNYQVDTTMTNIAGGARAQRLLSYSCSRLRKLYILPFLATASATTPANCCDPRQSLVSSAPNTVSYCKLANLQVYLGSTNVYIQPLSYDFLHFFSGPLVQQMPIGGGDWRSMVTSGRIRYSDWRRCYNVFVVDLERCSDSVTDELIKNIQISFQNDTQLIYSFVLVTEFQEEVTMDCITGQVVSSDGQQ